MKLNLDIKSIRPRLKKLLKLLAKYATFIVIILVLASYGFLVIRIKSLVTNDPNSDAVDQRIKALPRLAIDKNTLTKIQQLQDSNIQVKALFNSARNNPFQEQ